MRQRENTVWQPTRIFKQETGINDSNVRNRLLLNLTPGVQQDSTSATIEEFDSQHVLERVRGDFLHVAEGANAGAILHVCMAAFVVPRQVGKNLADADMPNLFASGDGEDYPIFINCVCGDGPTEPSTNIHMLDGKSKRRLDPGSNLVFSASFQRVDGNVSVTLNLALNLRILWKLLGS